MTQNKLTYYINFIQLISSDIPYNPILILETVKIENWRKV